MSLEPRFCADCGALCEPARWCYAIPTCYSCLPPPVLPRVRYEWADVQSRVLRAVATHGQDTALKLAVDLLEEESDGR